jgi:hypothetical protein
LLKIVESLKFILKNSNNQINLNVGEDNLFGEYDHLVNVINENLKELKINVFVLKNYVVIFIQFKKIKIC